MNASANAAPQPSLTPVQRDTFVADGLEAVLVGKDGGVKSRQTDHLDIQAFFGEIDQMPMRQREMRQQ